MKVVKIRHLDIKLPIYLPDATRGVVKTLDSADLKAINIQGVVVNTFHLNQTPGIDVLKSFGGIKGFMNFNGLVVSDSGGWQVFSLIHRSKKPGKVTDEGVVFSHFTTKIFTPEDSITIQMEIGSDIVICLDDFTPPDADKYKIQETVERTILWAKRSKSAFDKQIKQKGLTAETRPLLFAVIQGGWDRKMRRYCAEKLIELGFDGYGYGGYAIKDDNTLDLELSEYIVNLIPKDKIKFALGVGRPNDIAALTKMGWEIFDCTLPSRDARHKRLYTFKNNPFEQDIDALSTTDAYDYLHINKSAYRDDVKAVSEYCDCSLCKNHTRSYLYHLFKINEISALRLATLHNLRFYTMLIDRLQNLTHS